MGGYGGYGQTALAAWNSQPDSTSQVPQVPTTSSDSTQATVLPQNTNYGGAGIPLSGTNDLENQASQTFRQPQPQQQPQQQGGFSPDNPYTPIIQDYQARAQQTAPQEPKSGVKGLLQSFFKGAGSSMMVEAGLTPPDVRHDQVMQHLATITQFANQWEQMQGLQRYRDALTNQMTQNTAFESQMQPLRLQAEQQAVNAGQQAATTIHPAMSAADLKSLGVPDDLAAQYAGHQLTSADFAALKDLSAAGQTKIFDYGQDGSGAGKGQWLVDKNYNPIKQLSPISETGRATGLAKLQAQQQQALLRGMNQPVYAYDPVSKSTVLTTQTQAQQSGMTGIRGVKETDIRNDTHDTRVLNDVAVKSNNVLDSADALDQNEKQRLLINWALSQGESQLKLGAFGTQLPMGWANSLANSSNMADATQKTKDYVVNTLSLRESAMGLQKVLTGSARANEAQINALQATVPGFETNSALARQRLAAFTQNVDMLRQGIPRLPGIDTVPIRSKPQTGTAQTIGASGFNWNNFPVAGAPQ